MSGSLITDADAEQHFENAFRQGFLCPFCLEDLGDPANLQAHVEKIHPKTSIFSDEPFDHFRGIFDKARQRIRRKESSFLTSDSSASVNHSAEFGEYDRIKRTDSGANDLRSTHVVRQGIGVSRSHTEYFFNCRAPCINETAVHTNNLIIRLDKLINQCPSDASKRKAFERDIIPWVKDRDVSLCHTCHAKFTVTRRRHHCRLCGKVICKSCSQYLSFNDARKLTNPAFAARLLDEMKNVERCAVVEPPGQRTGSMRVAEVIKQAVSGESLQAMRLKSEKILSSTLSLVKSDRDGTEVSLASLLLQDENEHLRICVECNDLLHTRREKMDQLASPPILVLFYERLCMLFRNINKLGPSYSRIAESLWRGETMYTLESAMQMRNRIIGLEKEIDLLSTRIAGLDASDEDVHKKPSPRELIVRSNIRTFAVQTLQELAPYLVSLPNEDDFAQLQEQRREKIRQRDDERQKNASFLKSSVSNPLFVSRPAQDAKESDCKVRLKESISFSGLDTGHGDDGWTPSATVVHHNPFLDEEQQVDPLQEQVLIIKGYLKQAAEDGRLEEVKILERNLKDLEHELKQLKLDMPSE